MQVLGQAGVCGPLEVDALVVLPGLELLVLDGGLGHGELQLLGHHLSRLGGHGELHVVLVRALGGDVNARSSKLVNGFTQLILIIT